MEKGCEISNRASLSKPATLTCPPNHTLFHQLYLRASYPLTSHPLNRGPLSQILWYPQNLEIWDLFKRAGLELVQPTAKQSGCDGTWNRQPAAPPSMHGQSRPRDSPGHVVLLTVPRPPARPSEAGGEGKTFWGYSQAGSGPTANLKHARSCSYYKMLSHTRLKLISAQNAKWGSGTVRSA